MSHCNGRLSRFWKRISRDTRGWYIRVATIYGCVTAPQLLVTESVIMNLHHLNIKWSPRSEGREVRPLTWTILKKAVFWNGTHHVKSNGVTYQKTTFFTITAVKTWNPTRDFLVIVIPILNQHNFLLMIAVLFLSTTRFGGASRPSSNGVHALTSINWIVIFCLQMEYW
jgi:hypothetical protein